MPMALSNITKLVVAIQLVILSWVLLACMLDVKYNPHDL